MFRKLHEPALGSITLDIDGALVKAELGETVAAVLMRQVQPWSRLTPVSQSKRAPYCMMGVCFDCLAEVDGVSAVQTCMKQVCDGMRIARQTKSRKVGV